MADLVRNLMADMDAFGRSVIEHFRRQKWSYIFAAFVWALVWYAVMDVLVYLEPASPFPFDFMPLLAGVPIIIFGWRAVAIGDQLGLVIRGFDDGAAFVFPAGRAGAIDGFLSDLKKTIGFYSKLVSAAIFIISLVGVVLLTSRDGADGVDKFTTPLLVIGVPLISLPVGALLGQLVGYAQFNRIMDRHEIALGGLSTQQARAALHGLESVHVIAVVALSVLCFWFAGWWVAWELGYGVDYERPWRMQFLVLWIVSIVLFVAAGILPARSFRLRVAELGGGVEGRKAREMQIQQAKADLERWQDPAAEKSRRQRERIAELKLFIANMEDQRIESRLLDLRLLVFVAVMNLAILVLPLLLPGSPPAAVAS